MYCNGEWECAAAAASADCGNVLFDAYVRSLAATDSNLTEAGAAALLRRFDNSRCVYCNGFYGDCSMSSVCNTCHEFVTLDHVEAQRTAPQDVQHSWLPQAVGATSVAAQRRRRVGKLDGSDSVESGDSGNEDPEFEAGPSQRSAGGRAAAGQRHTGRTGHSHTGGHDATMAASLKQLCEYNAASHDMLPPDDFERLVPSELLCAVLTLCRDDDVTMWAAAHVNRRWRAIVLRITTSAYWSCALRRRWPALLHATQLLDAGHCVCHAQLYSKLMRTVNCLRCFRSTRTNSVDEHRWDERPAGDDASPRRTRYDRRIERETRTAEQTGFCVLPVGTAWRLEQSTGTGTHLQVTMRGPVSSPYEGGLFVLAAYVPPDYPLLPISVRFVTKMCHPLIGPHGEIALNLLHDWTPSVTLDKLLLSVQSLLTSTHRDRVHACVLRPELSQLYDTNRPAFDLLAQYLVSKYAFL